MRPKRDPKNRSLCQTSMPSPRPETMASTKSTIFELTIELEDVTLLVWRLFRVDPLGTLPLLHLIIQHVMGWKNSHLHSFQTGSKRFGPHNPDAVDLWVDGDDIAFSPWQKS